jgi:archaellum component FlaF (FlaF/FlaG flagellin family)
MRISCVAPAFLAVAFLVLAGCTMPGTGGSSVPTPGPTQTLPPGQDITIQVNQKDPIYATITVVFAGGEGQIAVSGILVQVTRPDGSVTTEHLLPVKGNEVTFQGSRETDRVEAWVTLNTGKTYKTVDILLPFRTRG